MRALQLQHPTALAVGGLTLTAAMQVPPDGFQQAQH